MTTALVPLVSVSLSPQEIQAKVKSLISAWFMAGIEANKASTSEPDWVFRVSDGFTGEPFPIDRLISEYSAGATALEAAEKRKKALEKFIADAKTEIEMYVASWASVVEPILKEMQVRVERRVEDDNRARKALAETQKMLKAWLEKAKAASEDDGNKPAPWRKAAKKAKKR